MIADATIHIAFHKVSRKRTKIVLATCVFVFSYRTMFQGWKTDNSSCLAISFQSNHQSNRILIKNLLQHIWDSIGCIKMFSSDSIQKRIEKKTIRETSLHCMTFPVACPFPFKCDTLFGMIFFFVAFLLVVCLFQSAKHTQISTLKPNGPCVSWCYSFSFQAFLMTSLSFQLFVCAATIKQKIAQIKNERIHEENQNRNDARQWNKTENARLNKCYWQIKSISHSLNYSSSHNICSCSMYNCTRVHFISSFFIFWFSFLSSSSSSSSNFSGSFATIYNMFVYF